MAVMIRALFGAVALVFSASCAFNGPPVPVSGTAADLEQLAGEWRGNYFGDVNHARRGTVMFRLVAGEDHAHGDVVMTAEGLDRPYHTYQPSQPLGSPPSNCQVHARARHSLRACGRRHGEWRPRIVTGIRSATLTR